MSVLVRHRSCYCRHCDAQVTTSTPRLTLAGGAIACSFALLVSVILASVIGPFIMFVLPLMALIGFGIGPLVMLASHPESCTRCGREVRWQNRRQAEEAGVVSRGTAKRAPAGHERAA